MALNTVMHECCAICLDDTCAIRTEGGCVRAPKRGDVYILRCRHGFHRTCLKRWYTESTESSPSCPCCRQPILFNKKSSFFNELLCRSKFTPISDDGFRLFSEFIEGLCSIEDKYIYYDTPGLALYIYDIKVNSTHHCMWSAVVSLCSNGIPFKR